MTEPIQERKVFHDADGKEYVAFKYRDGTKLYEAATWYYIKGTLKALVGHVGKPVPVFHPILNDANGSFIMTREGEVSLKE